VRRAAAILAAFALLAGCGGGDDEGDAEQTVRDWVEATNERDGERWCGELVTQEFIEQSIGARGDEARDQCEQQVKALKGLKLELVDVKETKVDGDEATVKVVLETGGQRQPRTFALEKDDGDWKLAGGSGG
jgi:hypothetical protein